MAEFGCDRDLLIVAAIGSQTVLADIFAQRIHLKTQGFETANRVSNAWARTGINVTHYTRELESIEMPPVKDFFDPANRQKLLEDALKKSKDGDERPCAFGVGKSGAFLALDFRNEHSPEKLLKEIKKSEFKDKFVVGTATIRGKMIDITSLEKKGNVRPKDIKQFLASGIKSTVSRAIIDGAADEEDRTAGDVGSSTAQNSREQRQIELDALERELAQLADEFQIA